VNERYVDLTPDQRAPFERYGELARRLTTGTVGLFELPAMSA
jgi:hypothetical protein